jgi:ABC-2 type transport system permease protein
MTTRIVGLHARLQLLELARYPGYTVPTFLFPLLPYLLFVVPFASEAEAELLIASFAGFAAMSVGFFQFGAGLAMERTMPWELYVRTLPVGAVARLAGRAVCALVFAAVAALVVVVVGVVLEQPSFSAIAWAQIAAGVLAGTVSFVLLGIALGYLMPPKAALPIANLLYLGLGYAGGLWFGADSLPGVVGTVSPVLPTRAWGELLWAGPREAAFPWSDAGILLGWTVAFAALAIWAYRRDEGRHFR